MKNLKIKNFIEKLQNLPDNKKKIILWIIVAILAIIMGYFWIKSAGERLNKMSESIGQINLPKIENPIVETPTDQTADWQTYTNTEYGFEIKYPKNIKYKEFYLTEEEQSSQIILETPGHNVFNLVFANSPNEEIINSGISLQVFKKENNDYLLNKKYAFEKSGYIFIIAEFGAQSIVKNFDQMISTFKFTL